MQLVVFKEKDEPDSEVRLINHYKPSRGLVVCIKKFKTFNF